MALARSKSGCPGRCDARHSERGFTLIELLISLTVLLIGVTGILSMHLTSMRATAYSRHATEAAVLGEDKMEELRTVPVDDIVGNTVQVNAQGIEETDGFYTVTWTMDWSPPDLLIGDQTVTVSWYERGFEQHALVFRTQRSRE